VSQARSGRWKLRPYGFASARALARDLGVSNTLATILVRRGLGEPAAARSFLDASEEHDHSRFTGIDAAVESILGHAAAGSRIAVHGDYDVDGVCSTAVLVRTLRRLGAEVRPRIPSRMDDGYGLSRATVEDLHARGTRLLITADCGIGAVEEVEHARSLGMDMVVTDHHRPGDVLPDCPVVHPGVCGYPADLCATGVTFKLSQALFAAAGRDPAELDDELDVVALATVADLVPLVGENRTLVRRGLRALPGTQRPGMRALMRVARVDPQSVDERTLGFALAPRINAAGRLYHADAGLELLMTEDSERALEIARELDAINTERQSVETATVFEAERLMTDTPHWRGDPALVLASEGWHPGVIGIVAARIVERYHRPCVLIALDSEGAGRGSGRSISPFDLHAGLGACAEHLVRFGGHRMAAGLEIAAARVDPFRRAFVEHATSVLEPADLVPVEHVDAVAAGAALGMDLAEELEQLRPFGMGNPGVNLLVPAARLSDVRPMGEGRHARFTVSTGGGRTRAVAFGVGGAVASAAKVPEDGEPARHDVVARLEVNRWEGSVEPRLVVRSMHDLPEGREGAAGCAGSCSRCSCGMAGGGWLDAVWRERERLATPQRAGTVHDRAARTVVNHGEGPLGALADVFSSDRTVLVVCADLSRRRALFDRALSPLRFGRPAPGFASLHCARPAPLVPDGELAVSVTDHAWLERDPGQAAGFSHLFLIDPPASAASYEALERSGLPDTDSWLHLGWTEAEVDFALAAHEHEHALRPALTSLWRALAADAGTLQGPALERALAGDGRHPRTTVQAARCIAVLEELDLVAVEPSTATVRSTMTGIGRTDLERSSAFADCTRKRDEGLRFLQTLTAEKESRRAA